MAQVVLDLSHPVFNKIGRPRQDGGSAVPSLLPRGEELHVRRDLLRVS